jgi:CheY-like chemotaxis protein
MMATMMSSNIDSSQAQEGHYGGQGQGQGQGQGHNNGHLKNDNKDNNIDNDYKDGNRAAPARAAPTMNATTAPPTVSPRAHKSSSSCSSSVLHRADHISLETLQEKGFIYSSESKHMNSPRTIPEYGDEKHYDLRGTQSQDRFNQFQDHRFNQSQDHRFDQSKDRFEDQSQDIFTQSQDRLGGRERGFRVDDDSGGGHSFNHHANNDDSGYENDGGIGNITNPHNSSLLSTRNDDMAAAGGRNGKQRHGEEDIKYDHQISSDHRKQQHQYQQHEHRASAISGEDGRYSHNGGAPPATRIVAANHNNFQPQAQLQSQSQSQSQSQLQSQKHSLHILLVDDSTLNRKMLSKLLQNRGHICEEAKNGQDAVDKVIASIRDASSKSSSVSAAGGGSNSISCGGGDEGTTTVNPAAENSRDLRNASSSTTTAATETTTAQAENHSAGTTRISTTVGNTSNSNSSNFVGFFGFRGMGGRTIDSNKNSNNTINANNSATAAGAGNTAATVGASSLPTEGGITSVGGPKASPPAFSSRYDVILMDFVMPVMDGPTATKAIRALGFTGPIIGLTGNAMDSDLKLFRAQGATDVLTKPMKIEDFDAVVKSSLLKLKLKLKNG